MAEVSLVYKDIEYKETKKKIKRESIKSCFSVI